MVGSEYSKVFKRGTNFLAMLTCTPGAKVMFLTNAFHTRDGIQVRLNSLKPQLPVNVASGSETLQIHGILRC
jgi:hypothetical protein